MKQRLFLIGSLVFFLMICPGTGSEAKSIPPKKSVTVQAVKKAPLKKAPHKTAKKAPLSAIQVSAPREDTFSRFLSKQTKNKQTCIKNALGTKKIAWLLNVKDAALGGADVKKVSRCVHYFIQY